MSTGLAAQLNDMINFAIVRKDLELADELKKYQELSAEVEAALMTKSREGSPSAYFATRTLGTIDMLVMRLARTSLARRDAVLDYFTAVATVNRKVFESSERLGLDQRDWDAIGFELPHVISEDSTLPA